MDMAAPRQPTHACLGGRARPCPGNRSRKPPAPQMPCSLVHRRPCLPQQWHPSRQPAPPAMAPLKTAWWPTSILDAAPVSSPRSATAAPMPRPGSGTRALLGSGTSRSGCFFSSAAAHPQLWAPHGHALSELFPGSGALGRRRHRRLRPDRHAHSLPRNMQGKPSLLGMVGSTMSDGARISYFF